MGKRTTEDELDLLAMNLTKIFLYFYIFLKAGTQNNGSHYGLFIHICHFVTIFLSIKTDFFLFPKICLAVYIANFVLSLAFKARHSGKIR